MTTITHPRLSFCNSRNSYRERIGLIPSHLCPSYNETCLPRGLPVALRGDFLLRNNKLLSFVIIKSETRLLQRPFSLKLRNS